jgi:hypothetical protein
LQEHAPHFLRFTEHHLGDDEIALLNSDNYFLGAHYSRSYFKKGGNCIYVLKSLQISATNLDSCCDKDMEVYAILITHKNYSICIVTAYRSPSNYSTFLSKMEMILRKLVLNKVKVIICGDINVNFMVDSSKKRQLEVMLASFNLSSAVTFPTRYGHNTSTAIDNIFLDVQQYDGYDVFAVSNGLSDHEAQLFVLNLSKPINIGN